jgi:hypothetical protein
MLMLCLEVTFLNLSLLELFNVDLCLDIYLNAWFIIQIGLR